MRFCCLFCTFTHSFSHAYTHRSTSVYCQQGARHCAWAAVSCWDRTDSCLVHWAHPMRHKVVDGTAALALACLPGTNCSLFDESPKCPGLHQQNEAVDRDVICQLQRANAFMTRDVPTQLRSAAAFSSVLFSQKEAAFSTPGCTRVLL